MMREHQLFDIRTSELKTVKATYEAPEPPAPVLTDDEQAERLPTISMAQLLSGLVEHNLITESEGEAWLAGNALPAEVIKFIETLPADVRFRAKAKAMRMSSAARLDPIVTGLGAMRNMDAAALNEFWRYCMGI